MKEQMTSHERILAAIDHKPIDRLPMDYWGTYETTAKLMKALGAKTHIELWHMLDLDKIIGVSSRYTGPQLKHDDALSYDYWGTGSRQVLYDEGNSSYWEMCHYPIQRYETIDEIEANYIWPKADWFDFSHISSDISKLNGYAIECGYIAPFYMYANIRGLEQTLMDLAADSELAHYIIGRICEFLYEYHKRQFEAADGKIDICQLTDDFGTQSGLIISTSMFERYFEPHYRKFAALIKHNNARIFHHDDGAIMPLLPKLVDIGIDVLNPIQWHLPGMSLEKLKHDFGNSICFHGGIDNQQVLPFGTTTEVRREVERCVETLAEDKTGYILAPCHNIQVITPVENVVEMYKAGRELSW